MIRINILELMAKNDMRTIQDLHEATGISRKTVSKIVNGESTALKTNTIYILCKALKCTPGDLLTYKEEGEN